MAQDGIVEAEAVLQFVQGGLVALDVQQHVVGLVHFLNGVGQLTPTPVLQAMNLAAVAGDQGAIAIDHGRHLFALVRVDD